MNFDAVFAEVVKQKRKDVWLVVEYRRVKGGGATCDRLLYHGRGSVEVVRVLKAQLIGGGMAKPSSKVGFDPVYSALGLKSSKSERSLVRMLFESSEAQQATGHLMSSHDDSPAAVTFTFARSSTEIEAESWEEWAWGWMKKAFAAAEILEGR